MKSTSGKLSFISYKILFCLIILLMPLCFLACDDMLLTTISVDEVKSMIDSGMDMILLDVREPDEYCDNDGVIPDGHIAGTINMPYESKVLNSRYKELDKNKPVIVICRSGNRSALASIYLGLMGFKEVYSMDGGMKAWTYTEDLEFCPTAK